MQHRMRLDFVRLQVAMGDGSVRFVKNSITTANWWYMNMRNDGMIWTDN